MKRVLEVEHLKVQGKEVSRIITAVLKDVSKLPKTVTSQDMELKCMTDAIPFLTKEFNCKIKVILAEEATQEKAKSALPGKVGIVVE